MPATIRELINADVLNTIAGISTGTGYANTVGKVEWAKPTGNPQTYPNVNSLFVVLFDQGDTPRESSPISKDDYDATIVAQCFFTQSKSSQVGMQDRNASIWGDLKKALMADRQRGSHPTNGGPLAFNTRIEPPIPIDTPEAQGVQVSIRVTYRTALDDPYSQ